MLLYNNLEFVLQMQSKFSYTYAYLILTLLFAVSLGRHGEVPKDAISANSATITQTVELVVSVNGEKLEQKVVIGLFGADLPETVGNFRKICEGFHPKYGNYLTYNGTPFHRIIQGFMVQGGDVEKKDGTGNVSTFGGTFKDEGFRVKHEVGCIAMANSGKDTNGSQFYITTAETEWLNGKFVVFGRVIKGMETVMKIEKMGKNNGNPKEKVLIETCQVLPGSNGDL